MSLPVHCTVHKQQDAIWGTSVTKVGVACVGICVSRLLKEELAWAIDKWLWIIS